MKVFFIKINKRLNCEFIPIWNNSFYQKRSDLINEATFTHDILVPIMKFIASDFFLRWDQAQSLSSKNRGVIKFVDTIGNVTSHDRIFEIFFVEVSHGPFHPSPENHIEEDYYKLIKLGKDGLDRNSGYYADNKVYLFHLHAEYICTYVLDRKISPFTRKIALDKIPIPFYQNDPYRILEFIKKLYKYQLILEDFIRICKEINFNSNYISVENDFETFPTPKKKRI